MCFTNTCDVPPQAGVSCTTTSRVHTLAYAFVVHANTHVCVVAGIDALLDAEDVAEYPDEKSIMTQLYSYYQYFTSVSEDDLAGQRLDKFLHFQLNIAKEQEQFEADASKLLKWIRTKVKDFQKKDFPNNVDEVKQLLEVCAARGVRVACAPSTLMGTCKHRCRYWMHCKWT